MFNDDSQFHDMTLEEFQKLIEDSSEVDIPLDSFQAFVDEVNNNDADHLSLSIFFSGI